MYYGFGCGRLIDEVVQKTVMSLKTPKATSFAHYQLRE